MNLPALPPQLLRPFFCGIGGAGMSALAHFLICRGAKVGGSDRAFDAGMAARLRARLEKAGARIAPQNRGGPRASDTCLVVSTAIEPDNPAMERAQSLKLPILHRSQVLARLASDYRGIAVAGTSGKSTVAGMTFQILREAGFDPSLINGASLNSLRGPDNQGSSFVGGSPLLVYEADESDGSIERYAPALGAVLNLQKDHKELPELKALFKGFVEHIQEAAVFNQADSRVRELQRYLIPPATAHWFGPSRVGGLNSGFAIENVRRQGWDQMFTVGEVEFDLPMPGGHNLANAAAAMTLALSLGAGVRDCSHGLRSFGGIERRLDKLGERRGITVVDDFAHNPAKIAACLQAVREARDGGRLVAIFHPHGFAPVRLLHEDLVTSLVEYTGPGDLILLPEIYYAGGQVETDVSSRDLAVDIQKQGRNARYCPDKEFALESCVREARRGDTIVSMGARDPELGAFARRVLARLGN